MSAGILKNANLKLLLTISLFTVVLVATPFILSAKAEARITEGLSFVHCNNRRTIGTVKWHDATMTTYRCSNGYMFANLKVLNKRSINLQITRKNSSGKVTGYQNVSRNTFSATTNMLGLYSKSCYEVRGYVGSARTHRFCW